MGSPDETRAVDEVDRDKADTVDASGVDRFVCDSELSADTWGTEISDSLVSHDGSEGEARYIHSLHGGSCEKRALADIRLTHEPNNTSQLNQLDNGCPGLKPLVPRFQPYWVVNQFRNSRQWYLRKLF